MSKRPADSDLHQSYLALHKRLDGASSSVDADSTMETVYEVVKSANLNLDQVQSLATMHADSALIYRASSVSVREARRLNLGDTKFDVGAFVSKIGQLFESSYEPNACDPDGSPIDKATQSLRLVGRRALQFGYRPPPLDLLLGPLDVSKKTTGARRPRRQMDLGRAQALAQASAQDLGENRQQQDQVVIAQIYHILERTQQANNLESVPFYDFILNPSDFGQSVENMFYVSFLVRDGRVWLGVDDEGMPVIGCVEGAETETEEEQENDAREQVIVDLERDTWQRLCEVLELEEPIIPTRDYSGLRRHMSMGSNGASILTD